MSRSRTGKHVVGGWRIRALKALLQHAVDQPELRDSVLWGVIRSDAPDAFSNKDLRVLRRISASLSPAKSSLARRALLFLAQHLPDKEFGGISKDLERLSAEFGWLNEFDKLQKRNGAREYFSLLLQAPQSGVRRRALAVLTERWPKHLSRVSDLVLVATKDKNRNLRAQAAESLRYIDKEGAMVALGWLIKDRDRIVRRAAIESHVSLFPDLSIQTLIEASADPAPVVRVEACKQARTQSRNAALTDALLGLVTDSNYRVQIEAVKSLLSIERLLGIKNLSRAFSRRPGGNVIDELGLSEQECNSSWPPPGKDRSRMTLQILRSLSSGHLAPSPWGGTLSTFLIGRAVGVCLIERPDSALWARAYDYLETKDDGYLRGLLPSNNLINAEAGREYALRIVEEILTDKIPTDSRIIERRAFAVGVLSGRGLLPMVNQETISAGDGVIFRLAAPFIASAPRFVPELMANLEYAEDDAPSLPLKLPDDIFELLVWRHIRDDVLEWCCVRATPRCIGLLLAVDPDGDTWRSLLKRQDLSDDSRLIARRYSRMSDASSILSRAERRWLEGKLGHGDPDIELLAGGGVAALANLLDRGQFELFLR